MVPLCYLMTILFSYVAHSHSTYIAPQPIWILLPILLNPPFKHLLLNFSLFFSLHKNRSLLNSVSSHHAAHYRKEKKCNKSFFSLTHDQTCPLSQCIFAPCKALWVVLKSVIRSVQIWIFLGFLPPQTTGDKPLGHRGVQRRLLKHEIIFAPEICRNNLV